MKLRNSEDAYVPKKKITGYLLSESHPVGKAKARYFRRLGYHDGNADELESSLIDIAQNHSVTETESTNFGEKYIVDGSLVPPSGRSALLRTVWIIEASYSRAKIRYRISALAGENLMIEDLDTVVLTKDIPSSGLQQGDMGAVVHRYPSSAAYDVEFVAADGRTIALLTLSQGEIRPRKSSEILHVRDLASA